MTRDEIEARARDGKDNTCPDCHGEGRIQEGFVYAQDVYGDAEIATRDVPCATCHATGTLTVAARAVRIARGGPAPIKPRRFA